MTPIKSVVLAYSGGLDTSAIVPWLKENYHCEVIAFVADVGQGADELEGIHEKAINSGASDCYVVDLQEKLVDEVISPSLRAGVLYEGEYLLGTALARPVIAQAQIELALKLGADAVAHGCTGKGNDQVRFESAVAALAPALKIIAPWREWDMRSRKDLLDYLQSRNVPTTASLTKIYSRDANLMHISHEGGELEDPWESPSDEVWTMTKTPEAAPAQQEIITLCFEQGKLVKVNEQTLSQWNAIKKLNQLGSEHGIGRIDIVENRLVGMKSRGCYETPGGTIWNTGLRALESLVLDRPSWRLRNSLGTQLADVLYDGQWFTPVRFAICSAIDSLSEQMTGTVRLALFKGSVRVLGRKSPNSLYLESFATFDEDEVYSQKDAEGFIRLFSLSQKIRALTKEAS